MKKAMIFDLDGTLSDSIHSIKYCADQALATVGFGPFEVEQYYYFIGDGAANLIKRALLAGGDEIQDPADGKNCTTDGGTPKHFEVAYQTYREIFKDNCMYQVKPYDGIVELLAALKELGIKLAVLSNKPHAETIRVVEDLFGKDCFDIIQGQMEGVAIKPNPEGGIRILEKFGIAPQDTLYLGDTGTDMLTGKALGSFTIGALWGFRKRDELEEHGADVIVGHPLEVLNYIG